MGFLSDWLSKLRQKPADGEMQAEPEGEAISLYPARGSAQRQGTELRPSSGEPGPTLKKPEEPWTAKKIPTWRPGDVVLDHYEIQNVITTGGMGRIYVAWHQGWKVPVAVKAPTEEMLSDPAFFARVEREAEAWTELGLHPNIAYCYFVRNIEAVPHIFVEYVDGGNLRDWIREGRCADLKVGLDLAIQFCHGMAHAHAKGLVHRDIKPGNILMTKDGVLKVTDFGIARWGEEEKQMGLALARGEDDTRTIGFIGTKHYASPEQWRDAHNVGPETDVFSFGVCLWEMLCGRRPYSVAAVKEAIPDPRTLRPGLPEGLYTLLTDLVAFEVETRQELGGFESLRERFKALYQELFHEPSPHSELERLDLEVDGLNNRGVSYLEMGKAEAAGKCWEAALQKDPLHLGATFNLGYWEWRTGHMTDDVLVNRMRELEGSQGADPDYWRGLGWIHFERGDTETLEQIQASEHRITEGAFLEALQDQDRPVGNLLHTFEAHTEWVRSVCFSPDGRYALSGSGDKTLRLWEVASGTELRRFEGHAKNVNSVCFSPDGRYALSGSYDNTLRLWEVESGKELRRFEGHTIWVNSVCFSPDGRCALSMGYEKTLRLWEVATGKELRRFEGHTSYVRSVCFSPDGLYALSGGDKTLRLWEVASGTELRRFEGHNNYVNSVCFSPDGRYALSGSADNTVRLWEVASGKELRQFQGHTSWVNSVCFSPDGRYALSGSDDKNLRLWEVANGTELRCFEGHTRRVESVCFSPDGRYALSGGDDKTLRLWGIHYPVKKWEKACPYPLLSRVKSTTQLQLDWNQAVELLGIAEDAIGKESFQEAYQLLREAQHLPGYARHHKVQELLTTCGIKGRGRRLGLRNAWLLRHFHGNTGAVTFVCFSPDGRYALSGGDDKTVRLWEVASGKELRCFEGHTGCVNSVCFSPDGRYALSGSYRTLRLWEVATGTELRRFEGHTDRVKSVCFSPDGRYALSGSDDKTLRLWDVGSGQELRRFEGHTDSVASVCFSPDGRYALSGSQDHTLRLWEVANGTELRCFKGHIGDVKSVCFSPDGRYALSGSKDSDVRLWEVASGKELRRFGEYFKGYLKGHINYVNSVCFSPDGRYALSGSSDKTVRLWVVSSGRELRRFEGHADRVYSACFSPDGRYALSGSDDKTLRLWEFDWEWEFGPGQP